MNRAEWLPPLQPLPPSQALWRICNHYQLRCHTILKRCGLTYLQFSIMIEVLAQPRGMAASYKQLSVALDVNERRLARAVKDLSERSLIRNYHDDMLDHRALLVTASLATTRKMSELLVALEPLEVEIAAMMAPLLLDGLRKASSLRPEPPEPVARAYWWKQTHYRGSAWRR